MAKVAILISCVLLLAVTCHAWYYSPPSSPSPPSPPSPSSGLSVGYYGDTCPQVEAIVREVVNTTVWQNSGVVAGLIRLLFHDCFVQGCDGSILLDPTKANPEPEKLSLPNLPGLRGFEVIDAAKAAVEKACPGVVSCADIVAFAARDASYFLSNNVINFDMPAGRLDGRVSRAPEALRFLPPPFFNLTQLVDIFATKGLDTEDMVVLSGAHAVGHSHCFFFTDRLSSPHSDIDPSFAASLRGQCPPNATAKDSAAVMLNAVSPNALDSTYYGNVIGHAVLFTSDASLLTSVSTSRMVTHFAYDDVWEDRFEAAMVKMAGVEVKNSSNGEIRKNCRVIN